MCCAVKEWYDADSVTITEIAGKAPETLKVTLDGLARLGWWEITFDPHATDSNDGGFVSIYSLLIYHEADPLATQRAAIDAALDKEGE